MSSYLDALLSGRITFKGGQYADGVLPLAVSVGDRLSFNYDESTGEASINVTDYIQAELAAAAPRWRSILNVDFAEQVSQTFTGNGNVEIDGQTFVVENYANIIANATHPIGVVNGQGLQLPCLATANNANYVANRTAPLVRWQFPNGVTNKTPVRAVCQMGLGVTSDGASDGPRVYLGIEYPRTTYRYQRAHYAAMRSGVATYTIQGNVSVCGSTQSVNGQGTVAAADLLGVTCPEGVGPMCRHTVHSGLYASHYDTLDTMRQLDDRLALWNANSLIVTDEVSLGSSWGVALSYCDSSVAAGYYASIRRLKVEAFY